MPDLTEAKYAVEKAVRTVDISLDKLDESDPNTIFNIVLTENEKDSANE